MKLIPVASRAARRRARLVDLLIEIQARARHQASIDAIGDRTARARWHFVRRIHEQLTGVPGLHFVVQLVAGLVARLRREDALDAIEDVDRAAIESAAFEAAGIIEQLDVAIEATA